jgi:protein TonB
MFETSLVGLQRKKGARQRWLSLPLAVALHLVVLSSLVFAQYWNVEQVPEPQVTEAFQVALPPPPPPAGPRGTVAPQPTHHPTPTATPDRPPQPAPPTVESEQPVPPPAPPGDAQVGFVDGVDHGDPNGVPGGDPNGVPGGVPNSVASLAPPPLPDEPIRYRPDMTRPQIVSRVQPQYTELARRARLQGTAIVEAVIDEEGRVRDVRILKSLGMGLDRAALDAVAQWRFTPATLNGRPIKVLYTLTVNFAVQ